MQQKDPKADAILKAIQEREKDHLLQVSLCNALAQVTDIQGLTAIVQQRLRALTASDSFIICISDHGEKQYHIFFEDGTIALQEDRQKAYNAGDGIFDTALKSAEPVVFTAATLSKKKTTHPFLEKAFKAGMREIVAMPLYYQKSNPSVLLLCYKKPRMFSREAYRVLKNISLQLSLTVCNILLTQKIAHYGTGLNPDMPETHADDDASVPAVSPDDYSNIIGQGKAMQKVISLIMQVAPSDSGVLLLGESGVGKEVIATAIHNNSAYRNKKMVRVNCAAIPANLIESELFGHEKGSFTGATERRIGKFEQANNSTLFLDEIGELPLPLQTKLLRVLQEREFERIGSSKTISVDVRIVAATNLNLLQQVADGRFRADLYYRLNIFPIVIPPLRERKEDIPQLCTHFITEFCIKNRRKPLTLAAKIMEALTIYTWPGNVRELKNTIERSILLTTGAVIKEVPLPEINPDDSGNEGHSIKLLEEVEREHILKAIKYCNGRISGSNGAAKRLGIPHTTLISKMQKLGIKKNLL